MEFYAAWLYRGMNRRMSGVTVLDSIHFWQFICWRRFLFRRPLRCGRDGIILPHYRKPEPWNADIFFSSPCLLLWEDRNGSSSLRICHTQTTDTCLAFYRLLGPWITLNSFPRCLHVYTQKITVIVQILGFLTLIENRVYCFCMWNVIVELLIVWIPFGNCQAFDSPHGVSIRRNHAIYPWIESAKSD